MSALTTAYNLIKAQFPQAVVSVEISVSANVKVTMEALQSSETISRVLAGKGGLNESIDMALWTLVANFGTVDIDALRGRTATVTKGGRTLTMRILSHERHALGDVVMLTFGDYDRTTA